MSESTELEFRAVVERRNGAAVLQLIGELDAQAEAKLQACIEEARLGPGEPVEVHLADLSFIDSTGLRCLVMLASRGRHVVLVDPNPQVTSVLDVGGLGGVFPIRRDGHPGPPFRAEIQRADGAVVLHFVGELDTATLARAQAALDDAGIGPDLCVEIHLDRLDYIDSAGLACLVEVRRRAQDVVLVNPSSKVDRALRISGLQTMFATRRDAPDRVIS